MSDEVKKKKKERLLKNFKTKIFMKKKSFQRIIEIVIKRMSKKGTM